MMMTMTRESEGVVNKIHAITTSNNARETKTIPIIIISKHEEVVVESGVEERVTSDRRAAQLSER